jgi:2-dehydropantoate 2-reductase
MKILVLGAGAIGGYYGARLRDAGADITFLVRERRAKQLAQQGLVVKSSLGDYSNQVPTIVAGDAFSGVDIVLLTCKAYDLEGACASIRPYLDAKTLIYPLLNGMLTYDWLDQEFGQERVLGGVAYIATTLMQDGQIEHMGANDTIIVGTRDDGQVTAGRNLFDLFAKSKGTRTWSDDIEQDLWEKWVMVASGGIITCLMRGVIGDVLASDDGEKLARQAIAESASVSKAAGHELRPQAVAAANRILLDASSRWGSSMMRDIEQGAAKIEGDQIVGDLVRRAAAFGLDVPLMRAAYCHLQVYQRRHES